MSLERAMAHLAALGFSDRVHELEESSATVALAAQAIGCEEARIAKTLSFVNGEGALLVLAAGDAKIDNAKFKKTFGFKAKMLPADRVEPLIGHAIGGVCPFGIEPGVPVWLDDSLKRFEEVYPAAGNAASMVRLSLEELEKASGAEGWVDVTKY